MDFIPSPACQPRHAGVRILRVPHSDFVLPVLRHELSAFYLDVSKDRLYASAPAAGPAKRPDHPVETPEILLGHSPPC